MDLLRRNIPEKVVFGMICFIAMLIPFHKTLASPVLLLSFIAILFSLNYAYKLERLLANKRYLFFASIFLLFVFGYFFSEDKHTAYRDLEVKFYLLAIPVFYVLISTLYVISCLLFILVAFSIAFYDFLVLGENHFYYKELLAFTYLHPSYAGMFQAFAAVLIVMHLLTNWFEIPKKWRFIYLALLAIITLFIFLLTAKMAIASIFILLSVAFYLLGKQILGKSKTIFIIVLGNVVAIAIMLSLPYTRERLKLLLTYNEVSYENSVNSRQEIWKAAIEVAQNNWLVGTGTGDAEEELIAAYQRNNFQLGVDEKYNAHNQYLQILVETGIVGLILFIAYLIWCLRLAIRSRNHLYLVFLLLWMVNITTESMLETQSGVVFFSFFNVLLAMDYSRK